MWHIARGWAARGWVEVSTTSASIRWIRPNYMYPDESSRVLVYYLEIHNMLSWYVYMELWIYIFGCMDEIFCALAYPTFVVVCSAVWYSLLRWSSTCWCEQMRGTPVGNMKVIVLLHSINWTLFLDRLFFRTMTHVLFSAYYSTSSVRLFNCFLLALWCA